MHSENWHKGWSDLQSIFTRIRANWSALHYWYKPWKCNAYTVYSLASWRVDHSRLHIQSRGHPTATDNQDWTIYGIMGIVRKADSDKGRVAADLVWENGGLFWYFRQKTMDLPLIRVYLPTHSWAENTSPWSVYKHCQLLRVDSHLSSIHHS